VCFCGGGFFFFHTGPLGAPGWGQNPGFPPARVAVWANRGWGNKAPKPARGSKPGVWGGGARHGGGGGFHGRTAGTHRRRRRPGPGKKTAQRGTKNKRKKAHHGVRGRKKKKTSGRGRETRGGFGPKPEPPAGTASRGPACFGLPPPHPPHPVRRAGGRGVLGASGPPPGGRERGGGGGQVGPQGPGRAGVSPTAALGAVGGGPGGKTTPRPSEKNQMWAGGGGAARPGLGLALAGGDDPTRPPTGPSARRKKKKKRFTRGAGGKGETQGCRFGGGQSGQNGPASAQGRFLLRDLGGAHPAVTATGRLVAARKRPGRGPPGGQPVARQNKKGGGGGSEVGVGASQDLFSGWFRRSTKKGWGGGVQKNEGKKKPSHPTSGAKGGGVFDHPPRGHGGLWPVLGRGEAGPPPVAHRRHPGGWKTWRKHPVGGTPYFPTTLFFSFFFGPAGPPSGAGGGPTGARFRTPQNFCFYVRSPRDFRPNPTVPQGPGGSGKQHREREGAENGGRKRPGGVRFSPQSREPKKKKKTPRGDRGKTCVGPQLVPGGQGVAPCSKVSVVLLLGGAAGGATLWFFVLAFPGRDNLGGGADVF